MTDGAFSRTDPHVGSMFASEAGFKGRGLKHVFLKTSLLEDSI